MIVDGLLARLAAPAKGKGKGVEAAAAEWRTNRRATTSRRPRCCTGRPRPSSPTSTTSPKARSSSCSKRTSRPGQPLRKLQELSRDGRAKIITCEKLKRNDLPTWIRGRAQMRKVTLDGPALMDLAEFVGDELRQLDQELIKLGDYAAAGR